MKKSVNMIFKNPAGKYLLQMREGKVEICNPLQWNCFGGGMEEDEDPIQAAVRETAEEIGIKTRPSDFELLGEVRPADNKRIVYVARYKKPVDWRDFRVNEGAGAGFFTKAEALKIDITGATRMLIERYF